MTLAESLANMMVEYIEGAKKMPLDWRPQEKELQTLFERRLSRFVSADKIAMVISEDASLQNGNLNTGFLAVRIAEVCEGKQKP